MIILGILPRYKLCSISGSPFSAPFSITVRFINILELSTNRFKHVVTLRVLLDNPETTEAVAGTDVEAVAVAMVVVVMRSNSGAGGNSGSDSNSNLLSVNKHTNLDTFLNQIVFSGFKSKFVLELDGP